MIDKIVTAYLKNNKRLVIPEFGAFIHKEGEEVVFVEFLKKDDRVLSSLLCREYAIDETEAQNIIGEYVTRIRRTVGTTGKYVVEGLGALHTDVNGLYALAFDPRARKETPDIELPAPEPPAPAPEQPVMQVYTREDHVERKAPAADADIPKNVGVSASEEPQKSSPNVIEFGFPEQKPEPKPADKKPFTLNDLYSIPASGDTRDDRPKPASGAEQTVRDDRFVQMPKRDDGYTQTQRRDDASAQAQKREGDYAKTQRRDDRDRGAQPAPERRMRRDDDWNDETPQRRPVTRRKRKKTLGDWIMIIAIIVALFALGSIIYGLMTSGDINIKRTDPTIENTVDGDTPETVDGVATDIEQGGAV